MNKASPVAIATLILFLATPCLLAKRKAPPAHLKGLVTVTKGADGKIEKIVIQKKHEKENENPEKDLNEKSKKKPDTFIVVLDKTGLELAAFNGQEVEVKGEFALRKDGEIEVTVIEIVTKKSE